MGVHVATVVPSLRVNFFDDPFVIYVRAYPRRLEYVTVDATRKSFPRPRFAIEPSSLRYKPLTLTGTSLVPPPASNSTSSANSITFSLSSEENSDALGNFK